ncbi:glutamate-5-semialdehyde dehydrogenase [Picosynechococcus sp. NKBG15041c]|uniref:glutamate-5-semialdehyde dehydrogenase n=1 Tax=Picosynechococcus sp. NKBG15041c TaxID=1407650 RepID=UPI0003F9C4F7|nr:glutamate-5-semialdehyde dehydrogenase [Picosynechococcus sp. NKBG15041c]
MASTPPRDGDGPIVAALRRAHRASLELELLKGSERHLGIEAIADAIEENIAAILEANTKDLEASREMAVPKLILEWLKLTPERLDKTIDFLRRLPKLPDPLQRIKNATYQISGYQTYSQRMPLGVICLIHEALPELGAIAAGLSLKTANSLVIRGCGEASHTNHLFANIMQTALADQGLPQGCVEALSSEEGCTIQELVGQDQYLNLIIPYGRPKMIQQVVQHATAPVLRTTVGNCYLYLSPSGEFDLASRVIQDSHNYEPDAVNAIEKVLVSPEQKTSHLIGLFKVLKEQGFELRGGPDLVAEFPEHLVPAAPTEWQQAYLAKVVAFKRVPDLAAAITEINCNSGGHADCIITESYQESRQFAAGIDSALVYVNASPCFSRHPQGSDSVFLGVSNQKGNRRGLIGLESFTTIKQVVQGDSTP